MPLSPQLAVPAPHDEIVAFACRCADAAGAAILPHFRQNPATDDKTGDAAGQFDPVTVADKGAEQAIRALIDVERPDDAILGEEFGNKDGTSGAMWVIDPIDGTRAFISGMPTWGTLLGYHDGTKPAVGIMDQAFVGDRFIGWPGGAALVRGDHVTPLKTRACAEISDAIFACTTPELFRGPREEAAYDTLLRKTKMLRLGTDCYAYCLLAHGLIDIVLEAGLKPFDIQALIPIVEGAGGQVTDWHGNSAENGGQVLATGDARLHEAVLKLLNG